MADEARRWRRMAAAGDVDGLWQVLTDTPWSLGDHAEIFRLLLRAIDVAVRADPARFSQGVFALMLGFGSYLMLRGQFYLGSLFGVHDPSQAARGMLPLPPQVLEWLPRLMQLQEHVAAIAESQARTARLWELAGRRRRGAACGAAARGDAAGAAKERPALCDAAGDGADGGADAGGVGALTGKEPADRAATEARDGDDAEGGRPGRPRRAVEPDRATIPVERATPDPAGCDRRQAGGGATVVGAPLHRPARRPGGATLALPVLGQTP
jgi:hypothetical protein